MTNIIDGLLYSKEDEWLKVDGDEALIGITDFAQNQLSDIVFVELPEAGESFESGDQFGTVESVKAVAELYMPVEGEVIGANEELEDAPELLNSDPYGAWIAKFTLSDKSQLEGLMDAAAYRAYCDKR